MSAGLPHPLQPILQGAGRIESDQGILRLVNGITPEGVYTNAQLCDYLNFHRRDFPNRAPLRLSLDARFSSVDGTLRGTAGFGFWNDPFAWTSRSLPALPRAVWFFFASDHANMRLAVDTPGSGWKAATLDALTPPAPLFLPAMGIAAPLMRFPSLFRKLWPFFQRRLRVCEQRIEVDMRQWAHYELEWLVDRVCFRVNHTTLLECASAPAGRLGLVIWIDNQYLVATPWGSLRHGVIELPDEQWVEIRNVENQSA